jgi:methyl-accepting chemotaxis protein
VQSITVSSKEQAAAIEQINKGIALVSQVVQTNAATAEESAAASEELTSQATALKEAVGAFTIKTKNAAPRPALKESPGTGTRAIKGQLPGATAPKVKIDLDDGSFGKY